MNNHFWGLLLLTPLFIFCLTFFIQKRIIKKDFYNSKRDIIELIGIMIGILVALAIWGAIIFFNLL